MMGEDKVWTCECGTTFQDPTEFAGHMPACPEYMRAWAKGLKIGDTVAVVRQESRGNGWTPHLVHVPGIFRLITSTGQYRVDHSGKADYFMPTLGDPARLRARGRSGLYLAPVTPAVEAEWAARKAKDAEASAAREANDKRRAALAAVPGARVEDLIHEIRRFLSYKLSEFQAHADLASRNLAAGAKDALDRMEGRSERIGTAVNSLGILQGQATQLDRLAGEIHVLEDVLRAIRSYLYPEEDKHGNP